MRHDLGRDDWATEGVQVGEDIEWRNNQRAQVQLGEVELISEAPINPEPNPMLRAASAPMMDAAKMGGEAEVSARLVELSAEVHVRFALLG